MHRRILLSLSFSSISMWRQLSQLDTHSSISCLYNVVVYFFFLVFKLNRVIIIVQLERKASRADRLLFFGEPRFEKIKTPTTCKFCLCRASSEIKKSLARFKKLCVIVLYQVSFVYTGPLPT